MAAGVSRARWRVRHVAVAGSSEGPLGHRPRSTGPPEKLCRHQRLPCRLLGRRLVCSMRRRDHRVRRAPVLRGVGLVETPSGLSGLSGLSGSEDAACHGTQLVRPWGWKGGRRVKFRFAARFSPPSAQLVRTDGRGGGLAARAARQHRRNVPHYFAVGAVAEILHGGWLPFRVLFPLVGR